MDKTHLLGIITEKGGVTSHTVILAKMLNIPAIVGASNVLCAVNDEDALIMDGDTGVIFVSPDDQELNRFNETKRRDDTLRAEHEKALLQDAVTLDGQRVAVNVNTGDADSLKIFNAEHCDGIGLFRTEFLYMDHSVYPDEETQFRAYKEIALRAKGKEVIIRTLDIGGDKQLGYMNLPEEENPFLGYRAIRICLDRPDVFQTQLRALLRASVFGDIKVMFPMVATLEEVLEAKESVAHAMRELDRLGVPYRPDTPLGIMIETPSAALISDVLASHVDFFSIGSNDLIQYMTATDRMNEKVHYLYDSCNLSVLRAIRLVVDNAHAAGIPVGICGEVASDPRLVPLWTALGIDELSVAPGRVGRVKYLIRRISAEEAKEALQSVFHCSVISDAKAQLDAFLALAEKQ